MRMSFALCIGLLLLGGCGQPAAGSEPICELSALRDLPGVRLAEVSWESAPVSHCKVTGVIGTETRFELLMPQRWNGKFVMGGGAGFAGVVVNIALNFGALQSGYATVGTDSGHYGHPLDASWALNNLERVVSFGHQAVHRTAVTAKALIAGYYGKETSRSLFYGCSRGGGQALMEAQRYPEDFDGIVAAGPAYDWTGELGARNIRVSAAMYPDPERLDTPVISAAKQQLIGAAVLAKCDAMDGLEDGILNNPLMCDFDVQSLKCGDQPAPSCLTEEELTTVRTIYEDFYVDGALVYPGYPPGAELYPGGWSRWLTGGAEASGNFQSGIEVPPDLPVPSGPNFHFSFGNGVMKYLVFHDPDWDYSQYSFDSYFKDVAAASQTLDAKDPNLDAFRARGGKLLLANSWGDSAINPKGTISYYEKVIERDPSAVDDVRLILFPGVEHCAGGPGPWFVNFVQVIDQWVETGAAPEKLEPFWLNERMEPEGSRLACAYPEYPVYTGSGDTRDASSFRCEGAGAVADSD